ncbi:MAG TPA: hypothetical protein VGO58_04320 [Chitinophagaceae bacterium]|jgi:YD repeat-containing protein|nr:hypothetical protein [Chitinophagaceae bacterium]
MKKIIFILLAATTFVACEKNNDAPPVNPGDFANQIKKTVYDGGQIHTYTYDGSGRIKTRTALNLEKIEYDYTAGKIVEKQFDATGVLKRTYTYELDTNGLVAKETRSDRPDFTETRLYNSDKQVVKFTDAENANIDIGEYFYSNGNLDSIRFISNGNWYSTAKMTYYTDKTNILDNDAFGEYAWGKRSKNMVKSEQYFFSDGTIGDKENYTYEYDAKGRVTKVISTEDGDIYTTTYSYE